MQSPHTSITVDILTTLGTEPSYVLSRILISMLNKVMTLRTITWFNTKILCFQDYLASNCRNITGSVKTEQLSCSILDSH